MIFRIDFHRKLAELPYDPSDYVDKDHLAFRQRRGRLPGRCNVIARLPNHR